MLVGLVIALGGALGAAIRVAWNLWRRSNALRERLAVMRAQLIDERGRADRAVASLERRSKELAGDGPNKARMRSVLDDSGDDSDELD